MVPSATPRIPAARMPSSLVGRDEELARLHSAWTRALEGERRIAFLRGEPGIGKTRLASEFAREVERAGARVLVGRCDEDPVLPYEPFVEALRQAATAGSAAGALSAQRARQVLAELVPASAHGVAGGAAEAWSDAGTRRYVLFERVRSALHEAASEQPLLLFLDDLHWADAATIRLLRYLARGSWGVPALLLGSYRDTELANAHALRALVSDLHSDGFVEHIALRPLSGPHVRELAARRAGRAISLEDSSRIHDASGGNPLFVEALVELLSERVEPTGDGDAHGSRLVGGHVPAAADDVIDRRLSRLSAGCRELLARAAVLGSSVPLAPLRGLWDGGEDALAEGLAEAVGASLLVEAADAARPHYRFVHSLVQQALYQQLPLPRRQQLHLRAARALAAGIGGASTEGAAKHYRLAGDTTTPDEALPHARAAAETALAVSALDEAVGWWEYALQLMERQGADVLARAELLERMADVLGAAREQRRVTDCLERALRLYERTDDRDAIAKTHARLSWAHSDGNLRTTDLVRARAHLAAAEAAFADGAPGPELADFHLSRAVIGVSSFRIDELEHAQQACRLAVELGRPDIETVGIACRGMLSYNLGNLAESSRLLRRTWQGFRVGGVLLYSGAVAFLIAIIEQRLGNPLEAARWLRRELDDWPAPRPPAPWGRARRLVSSLADAGDLPAMRALARERAARDPERIEDAVERCAFAFFEGDWHGPAWAEAEGLARGAAGRGDSCSRVNLDHWLVGAWRARGDAPLAIAALEEELATALAGGSVAHEAFPRAELAVLCAEGGDLAAAAGHLGRLRTILASGEDWRGIEGKALQAEALLATAEGGPDRAAPPFERAIAIFRRYSTPWPEAQAFEDWARVLRSARRRVEAAAKRREAEAVYRRIGAGQPWLDRLDLIAGGNGTRRDAPSVPDGLTPREAEVLRLLAAGSSNREIAEALVLSPRTVERHITNIYGKIGARGKADATAYALHHSLI